MPSTQLFGYIPFSRRLEFLRDLCEFPARKRPALLDMILDKDLAVFELPDLLSTPKRCCAYRHEACPRDGAEQSSCSGREFSDVGAVSKPPEKAFLADFDTTNFSPDEISVTVSGRQLTVEAEHKETRENRKVYRRTVQTMTVPDWLDTDSLKSCLSNDGILRVRAPPGQAIKDIPIARSISDSSSTDPKVSREEEEDKCTTSDPQVPV